METAFSKDIILPSKIVNKDIFNQMARQKPL